MTPFHLGPTDRRLFAMLHMPAQAMPSACVLLSPPFGQEAVRAHRFLRVLAERLTRAGLAVLRFDPYGSGDSAGEDEALTLAGWTDDVVLASGWLFQRFPGVAQRWFGMGLGATAMLGAASSAAVPPQRLVLDHPVSDGPRYLGALRERHVLAVEAAVALPPQPRPTQLALADAQRYTDEALGFGIGAVLRTELLSLQLPPLTPALAAVTSCLRDAEAVYGPVPAGLPALAAEESFNWMVDSADNGTLIPARLLMQVTRLLDPRP